MGYTTEFTGKFSLDKVLTPDHKRYLEMFAETRRMKRNPDVIPNLSTDPVKPERRGDPEPVHKNQACLDLLEKLSLSLGTEGGYYCGSGYAGQGSDKSIVDYNQPPTGQPGLWCQWIPTKNGKGIEWNGQEKFYAYVEWLEYLIKNFLKPWGYTVSGIVRWQGEDSGDKGILIVKKNKVNAYGIEEYKVLQTPVKELPLLLGKLKTDDGKARLAKRLKEV